MMKNIIEFPDRQQIEQEAVDWLIKLDGDQPPTEQDLAALKEWMARSPIHTQELENLGDFWGDLIVLTELNVPVVKPSTASTENRAAAPWAAITQWFNYKPAWAMALTVVVIALTIALSPPRFDSANGYYASAIGQQTAIPLADGSIVHLNTNSQIKVDYSEGYRNIRLLQGEAHFDVAQNKSQPFRVYAGEGRVQAVGTAFTVYLRQTDIQVLVTEGKVDVAAQRSAPIADTAAPPSQTQPTETAVSQPAYYLTVPVDQLGSLTQGQGATLLVAQQTSAQPTAAARQLKPMDKDTLKQRDAWRQGLLLFAGDSLEDVVSEVSRYTTVNIEIADPELRKIRIGGQFKVGDISGMFDVLETNFGLAVTLLDDNRVRISAAQHNKNSIQ